MGVTVTTRELRHSRRGRRCYRRHLAFVRRSSGSTIVAALEHAYGAIRDRYPELPAVIVVTGSGLKSYGLVWAHFARDRWQLALSQGRRPEVFVGGECLAQGAAFTMETLLHEVAHALAFVRGIDDTSRQGRYHNRKFVALAAELGLEWPSDTPPHPTIGFSEVRLTPAGRETWREPIERLERAITASMGMPILTGGPGVKLPGGHGGKLPGGQTQGPKTGGGRRMKFMCSCEPARSLYMAASQWEISAPYCKECESDFE